MMVDVVNLHLWTSVHVHIPLVVPRGPLGHLRTPQNPHDVGGAVADEALLACAVGVGAVETPFVNRHFLKKDQRGPERLPAIRCNVVVACYSVYTSFEMCWCM